MKGLGDAAEATFAELDVVPAADGRSFSIRGCATGTLGHGYSVAQDGTADVASLAATFGLRDFLAVLDRDGPAAAAAVRDALPPDGRLARLATSVLAGRDPRRSAPAPADVPADVAEWPLSRAAAAEARVGWLEPAYDHLPRRDALLAAAGRVFDIGIYAHAPALHRYDLTGKWERLRGSCGLVDQAFGSVVCAIRVDGREVFRSGRLTPGRVVDFDVDVVGGRALELVVEDAGDTNRSDWAAWLDPVLVGPAAGARP